MRLKYGIFVALFAATGWVSAENLDEKLIDAVKSSKLPEVRSLLAKGASPNAADRKGRCVLDYAFERLSRNSGFTFKQEGAIFEELLKAGSRVPSGRPELANEVLLRAILGGNLELAAQAKAKGGTLRNDGGGFGLCLAARAGKLQLTKQIVEAGADVNFQEPAWVLTAIRADLLGGRLENRRDGTSPLMNAVVGRHLDVAKFLLSLGADPLRKMVYQSDPAARDPVPIGRRPEAWATPVDVAAVTDQPEMLGALLTKVSPRPSDADALARPMFFAALKSLSCLKLLVEASRASDRLQAVAHLWPIVEAPGEWFGDKVNAVLAAARAPSFHDYFEESRMFLLARYFEAPTVRSQLLERAFGIFNKSAERTEVIEKANGQKLGEVFSLLGLRPDGPLTEPGTQPGELKVNPRDGQPYVWIPPGKFTMGCSSGDDECFADEKPAHEVEIKTGFWLGQTATTVGAWKRYAQQTGRSMPPEPTSRSGRALNPGWSDEQQPLVNATWEEASAYCQWMGGWLPTEAQWEYAARAGMPGARYADLDAISWNADNSGKQRIDSTAILMGDQANYSKRLDENENRPRGVGLKLPNGWKLYDMLGNVLQWTEGWYDSYQQQQRRDPQLPPVAAKRVARGGTWTLSPRSARVSGRFRVDPGARSTAIGFRCASGPPLPELPRGR